MTQFVLHQQYENFPLFRIYNHDYTPKPQLKINNIKITQNLSKQQKQQHIRLKNQIHSSEKNRYAKGKSNLINRTIQLIFREGRYQHPITSHQISLNQVNQKLILNRHNHKSVEPTHRKLTIRSRGRNLSSLQDYTNINEDFNDKKMKKQKNQNMQHFQDAFKPVRIRINHGQPKKSDGEVLSLSFLRFRSSERTYSRFAQRNMKLVEQRQKRHTFNQIKNRPNTTQINYQKKTTQVLQPW